MDNNHDHPLIKMIRLSDEESNYANNVLSNGAIFTENKILSKLTALMTDGLPTDDEIKIVSQSDFSSTHSQFIHSRGAKWMRSQASLLIAKERAEMEEMEICLDEAVAEFQRLRNVNKQLEAQKEELILEKIADNKIYQNSVDAYNSLVQNCQKMEADQQKKVGSCREEMLDALILANKLITGYVPALGEEHMKIKNAINLAQSC